MARLKQNQRIGGYEIVRLIARGGMGEVYIARQVSMDRTVALKVLSFKLAKRDPAFAKQFIEEARNAGRFNHPNLIAVHDVGKATDPDGHGDVYYFSMEYIDGENFRQYLEREGAVPIDLVGTVMQAMADALVYAERIGIVHRDIKPENIMFSKHGQIKLADLGLAKQIDTEDVDEQPRKKGRKTVMGTPRYMSPEQARALSLDHRSDMYSLGATLYHLLTGEPPFDRANAKDTMKAHVFDPVPDPAEIADVPEAWRRLTRRLMAKKPEERFDTAEDMADAIRLAVQGRTLERSGRRRGLGATGERRKYTPPASTVPWNLIVPIGVVLLALALAVTWYAMNSEEPPTPTPPPGPDVGNEDGAAWLAEQQMADAQAVIDGLSGEPREQLATVRDAMVDGGFEEGSEAWTLLNATATRLQADIDREETAQRGEAERLASRMSSYLDFQRFRDAQDLLDQLEPPQRTVLADRWAALTERLNGERQALADRWETRIGNAESLSAIDRTLGGVPRDDLTDAQWQQLQQSAEQRRRHFRRQERQEAQAMLAEDQARWDDLARYLDSQRANTDDMQFYVSRRRPLFRTQDFQDLVGALSESIQAAENAESWFRTYVESEAPRVAVGGRDYRLTGLDDASVQLTTDSVGAGASISRPRDDEDLDLAGIFDQAIRQVRTNERQVMRAAWLWLRQPPTAGPALADLDESDQRRQAMLRFNQAIGEPIDLTPVSDPPDEDPEPAPVRGVRITHAQVNNGVLHADYDFGDPTCRDDFAISEFPNQQLTISTAGLRWTTHQITPQEPGVLPREADLPTLVWNQPLAAPIRITMNVVVERPAFGFIGVRRGNNAARFGCSTQNGLVFGVITDDNARVANQPLPSSELSVLNPFELIIEINEEGVITFQYNGASFPRRGGPQRYRLDGDGPFELVIQTMQFQASDDGSTLVIQSLTAEGRVP